MDSCRMLIIDVATALAEQDSRTAPPRHALTSNMRQRAAEVEDVEEALPGVDVETKEDELIDTAEGSKLARMRDLRSL